MPARPTDQMLPVLAPQSSLVLPAGHRHDELTRAVDQLACAPPGTLLAVSTAGPIQRHRLQRTLKQRRATIDREYLLIPSAARPVLAVERAADTLRWSLRALVTVPPGAARTAAPTHAAIALCRQLPPGLLGRLIPGRLTLTRLR